METEYPQDRKTVRFARLGGIFGLYFWIILWPLDYHLCCLHSACWEERGPLKDGSHCGVIVPSRGQMQRGLGLGSLWERHAGDRLLRDCVCQHDLTLRKVPTVSSRTSGSHPLSLLLEGF